MYMQDTTFLKCIKKSASSFSYSKPFRANYPALICLALGFGTKKTATKS